MIDQFSFYNAFESRLDLKKYKDNALLLFALQLRFQLEDIDTIASNVLTDGQNDKKCDLVYVDRDEGYAVIGQGYMSNDLSKRAAKANKASDLNTAASWLLVTPIENVPTKIQTAAIELRNAIKDGKIRSLQFWYVHNLSQSKPVKDELNSVEHTTKAILKQLGDNNILEVTAIEVGRETLEEWYRSLTIPILISETISVKVERGFSIQEKLWEAFVTAVPGIWVYNLFQTHKSNLFSANVRGYLGSRNSGVNINNGIKKTASESPENFWVYNNGITALVNKFHFDPESGILELSGLSIVNGAQTTGAIGSLKQEPDKIFYIPARFIMCNTIETVRNIIRFNNSQNAIEAPDFRSNDPIQKRLVDEFNNISNAKYLGGRRGGDEDIIKRQPGLLPSDTVAQALASFHQDPIIAYNEKSKIWVSDELYARYFSERTTAKHIVFAYSLLKAIEAKKHDLINSATQNSITDSEKSQLEFLRLRGATFLMVAAVAACIETFVSRVIPDKFKISFGSVSPDKALEIWQPIIETTTPLVSQLIVAAEKGLQNTEIIKNQIKIFQSLVEATKYANIPVFKEFTDHINF